MVIKLVDGDYKRFLNDRTEDDGTLIDPAYKFFLEHLKEDGKSYVFKMLNVNHGLPTTYIKYESEDGLFTKCKLDTQISSGNNLFESRGDHVTKIRGRCRRSCSKSGQVAALVPNSLSECDLVDDSCQKFPSPLKIEGRSMSLEYEPGVSITYEEEKGTGVSITQEEVKKTLIDSESLGSGSIRRPRSKSDQIAGFASVPKSHSGCPLVDESYKKFLSLLKIEGNSMILEYEAGVSVTYEQERGSVCTLDKKEKETSTSSESLTTKSTGTCSKSDQVAGNSFVSNKQSECSLMDESYQKFPSHLKIGLEYEPGISVIYEEKETGVSVAYEEERGSVCTLDKKEKETSTSSESLTTGSTGTCSKSDQVAGNSFVSNKQSECSLMDESYQKFLSHLKIGLEYEPGISVIYEEKETGVSVAYEEEKEISTGSETFASEGTIYSDEQNLLPYMNIQPSNSTYQVHEDNCSILSLEYYDSSEFSNKLLAILKKPFDQNEYEKLLNEATAHKPLIREKHLRGKSKSYPTNAKGLSYLDYYPDLEEQIDSADCYKRLILLRGFFFWLENLCQEGAFRPWVSQNKRNKINRNSDCELVFPLEKERDEN